MDKEEELFNSIERSNIAGVQVLIRNGVNVNCITSNSDDGLKCIRKTALMKAVSCNSDEKIIRLLLDSGAYINMQIDGGYSALHHVVNEYDQVVDKSYENRIKLLLENGANVNLKDNCGNTSLHIACSNACCDKPDIVKLLLQHNGDVNNENSKGCTALHYAAYNCHINIVKLLLDWNADCLILDEHGLIPIDIVDEHGREYCNQDEHDKMPNGSQIYSDIITVLKEGMQIQMRCRSFKFLLNVWVHNMISTDRNKRKRYRNSFTILRKNIIKNKNNKKYKKIV
jgi:hypothetical protein